MYIRLMEAIAESPTRRSAPRTDALLAVSHVGADVANYPILRALLLAQIGEQIFRMRRDAALHLPGGHPRDARRLVRAGLEQPIGDSIHSVEPRRAIGGYQSRRISSFRSLGDQIAMGGIGIFFQRGGKILDIGFGPEGQRRADVAA